MGLKYVSVIIGILRLGAHRRPMRCQYQYVDTAMFVPTYICNTFIARNTYDSNKNHFTDQQLQILDVIWTLVGTGAPEVGG